MEENKHRIAYAFYSEQWQYKKSHPNQLEKLSTEATPEEFCEKMRGKIFCPLCATPLSRAPSTTSVSTNSITAHFKHGDKVKYPESAECRWRTPSAQGLKYNTEEEARKAIENKELTIVNSWMEHPPSTNDDIDDAGEYDRTAVEDRDGPETDIPIGRHHGEIYKLPSKIFTIMAVCREFPKNLRRGFYFPNTQTPMLLIDQLHSADSIKDLPPKREALFFGKIVSYRRLDRRNVITLSTSQIREMKIYTIPSFDERKRINGKSIGRYILFFAQTYWESEGEIAACKVAKWGAYSLLPNQHEKFLPKF